MKVHHVNLIIGMLGIAIALTASWSARSGMQEVGEPNPPSEVAAGPIQPAAENINIQEVPYLDLDLSKLPQDLGARSNRTAVGTRVETNPQGNRVTRFRPRVPFSSRQESLPPAASTRDRIAPQTAILPLEAITGNAQTSPSLTTPRSSGMIGNPAVQQVPFVPSGTMIPSSAFPTHLHANRLGSAPVAPSMHALSVAGSAPIVQPNGAVHGGACPCGCQPRCTTQTIQVPVWETRYINQVQTRYRQELRQRTSRQYYTVYDDVPKVESYTVQVPQPRTRTYTVNVQEEYQEAVPENFTIMVRKPMQRESTVDREEAYKVPVETPYTVMVPERRAYQETTYRTETHQEPRQVKYVQMVPKKKKRAKVVYDKLPVSRSVFKPRVRMVTKVETRPKIKYRTETRTRQITEEYVEYVERSIPEERTRFVTRTRPKQVQQPRVVYEDRMKEFDIFEYSQVPTYFDKVIPYTEFEPFTETKNETYYVNEPYEETITRTYPTRIQVPRTVTQTYDIVIPETNHVSQAYSVKVPYETMRTAYRTITRQVPVTKYRTITRDMGTWERRQVTCPTCEVSMGPCGCEACVSGMKTCVRNVWCPRIVTQRIPYTDFQDVQQRIPYAVPEVKERIETRTRMVPVTRYRKEQKTADLKVYDFQNTTRTQQFTITKYHWVAKTRPVTMKNLRQAQRQRTLPFVKYEPRVLTKKDRVTYQVPTIDPNNPIVSQVTETFQQEVRETVELTVKVPVTRTRTRTEEYTVNIPETVYETYKVTVPESTMVETEETSQVEMPRVVEEEYTEMVPEIRTREEMVSVKQRVPVFTTKYKTEMVPQIKTRTTYRTETRTVSEKVLQTYWASVPMVQTRNVQKTRYRDVPQTRTEVYWENVPETRYRTRMVRVPRQVARETKQTYTVNIPYQVTVCVPVQVCKMVTKTITVPVEECCPKCGEQFKQLHDATGAYLQWGGQHLDSAYRRWLTW